MVFGTQALAQTLDRPSTQEQHRPQNPMDIIYRPQRITYHTPRAKLVASLQAKLHAQPKTASARCPNGQLSVQQKLTTLQYMLAMPLNKEYAHERDTLRASSCSDVESTDAACFAKCVFARAAQRVKHIGKTQGVCRVEKCQKQNGFSKLRGVHAGYFQGSPSMRAGRLAG